MERDHKSEENSSPNRLDLDVTGLTTQLCQSDFAENLSTQTPLMEKDPDPEAEERLYPNWLELPREVTLSILDKLDALDILENVQRVCTQWESICKDPSLWRTVIFRNEEVRDHNPWHRYRRICKQAVDLSCGGLIDIYITDFYHAGHHLLHYITQRCTQIRRLRLVRVLITDDDLCEAADRLSLLEDLEISYCNLVTATALHKIGECCPLLKSLKKNRYGEKYPPMDDSEAEAIAGNMVELCHLQLFGNRLTNKGLKAILDSCSHLESLDLRQCFNINLDNSSLGKICAERIKDFRAPCDSTNDYEYGATLLDFWRDFVADCMLYDLEFDPDIFDEVEDGSLSSRDVDFWYDNY